MNATKSTDGNCPCCHSTDWKTLEALALTERTQSTSTTTGRRWEHLRETTGSTTTDLAAKYPPPARPADYDRLAAYRRGCNESIDAANARMIEIDAAARDPKAVLRPVSRRSLDNYSKQFDRNVDRLKHLFEYERALARWKATRICMRCAAAFIDSRTSLPTAPVLVFRFVGEDRRCPHCQSYFWNDPYVLVEARAAQAEEAMAQARTQLRKDQDAAARAAAAPPRHGLFKRLAAFVMPAPRSAQQARDAMKEAELSYQRGMLSVRDLRDQIGGRSNVRFCDGCRAIYPAVFETAHAQ